MSTGLAHRTYDKGGLCYSACQEAFEWYHLTSLPLTSVWFTLTNPNKIGGTRLFSGARRAVISEEEEIWTLSSGTFLILLFREEADNMCKMLAASNYALLEHEDLEFVEDKRVHATMYPVNATNLYKACLAGVRRQRYWIANKQPLVPILI